MGSWWEAILVVSYATRVPVALIIPPVTILDLWTALGNNLYKSGCMVLSSHRALFSPDKSRPGPVFFFKAKFVQKRIKKSRREAPSFFWTRFPAEPIFTFLDFWGDFLDLFFVKLVLFFIFLDFF